MLCSEARTLEDTLYRQRLMHAFVEAELCRHLDALEKARTARQSHEQQAEAVRFADAVRDASEVQLGRLEQSLAVTRLRLRETLARQPGR